MKGTTELHRSRDGITRPALAVSILARLAACSALAAGPALAQPTPPGPASAQPSLPRPLDSSIPAASPILGGEGSGRGAGAARPAGQARGRESAAAARRRVARRHFASRRHDGGLAEPLERPALAGVELVAPIPVPRQPPHFTVPVPAYPLENVATFYTTPLPPVVCHRVPRDPTAPDPHLIRETTVLCEADNP